MPANKYDDPKTAGITGLTLAPAVYAANTNGTGVDFLGSEGLIHAVVSFGVIDNATSGTVSFEESTDNTTFTAISGATSISYTGTSDASTQASVAFERTKRYLRAVITAAGGGPSVAACVTLHSQKKSF